jgi:hypothetical protein
MRRAILICAGLIAGLLSFSIISPPLPPVPSAIVSQIIRSIPAGLNFLQALSALATLLSTYYALRADKRAMTEEDRKNAIDQGMKGASTLQSQAIQDKLQQVIDPKTLETLKDDVVSQLINFDNVLSDPNIKPKDRDGKQKKHGNIYAIPYAKLKDIMVVNCHKMNTC